MGDDITEKEQKLTLNKMWRLHFDVTASEDKHMEPEQRMMFWNQMGWLGNEEMIDPNSFNRVGFLREGINYIESVVDENDANIAYEHLSPIIDFIDDYWRQSLKEEVPSLYDIENSFFAGEGEINGSLSTE